MPDDSASEALREIALMAPRKNGPKLHFPALCAAYAALLENISPALIARVFGLSKTSISYLGGCRADTRPPVTMELPDIDGRPPRTYTVGDLNITRGRSPDRKPRYQEVAREFNRLGYDLFKSTYFTEEWQRRLKAAAQTHLTGDPAAAFYAFVNYGPVNVNGDLFRIDWRENGWRFAQCQEDGSPWRDEYFYQGDDNDKPFMTSDAAYKYLTKWLDRDKS